MLTKEAAFQIALGNILEKDAALSPQRVMSAATKKLRKSMEKGPEAMSAAMKQVKRVQFGDAYKGSATKQRLLSGAAGFRPRKGDIPVKG